MADDSDSDGPAGEHMLLTDAVVAEAENRGNRAAFPAEQLAALVEVFRVLDQWARDMENANGRGAGRRE